MKKDFEQRLTDGNWMLEHRRYLDDFGFQRDAFEMVETKEDGRKVHYPFHAPMKTNNYTRETNIADMTCDYTNKEYQEMLETMREKFALQSKGDGI